MPRPSRIERQLRSWSGLIVGVFVVLHLTNHAAAIFSLELAETIRAALNPIWHSDVGSIALYGAFAVHAVTALMALYRRSTWRMPAWEAVQLLMGLAVVPLLAGHVIGTRGAHEVLGTGHDYTVIALGIWSAPSVVLKQVALTLVVWLHLVIGLHFWFRLMRWYPRWQSAVHALFVLIPVLALIGLLRAGQQAAGIAEDEGALQAALAVLGTPLDELMEFSNNAENSTYIGFTASVLAVIALRLIVNTVTSRRGAFELTLPDARAVRGAAGMTMLDALRAAGIPHASVCGGRGRCTTCRVRVGAGSEVPPAAALERLALERIGAPPNVRLACQARPTDGVAITPLIAADAGAGEARRPGGVSGQERVVTAMFLDLRGSTGLGERRLPYDVLFILNQFFAEMALGLAESRGHYAQFAGDGLMALYGLERSNKDGALDALTGATRMLRRLENLNARLEDELDEPLRIGIGIHTGDAIVGTMGPPTSPNYSAIGDNINIAARLEAKTKAFECSVIVSAATLRYAGVDTADVAFHSVDVRGREGDIDVAALSGPEQVEQLLHASAAH